MCTYSAPEKPASAPESVNAQSRWRCTSMPTPCGRRGILARGAQQPAEAALLVGERDRDHDQHADRGLHAARRLGHQRERRLARPDRRPVAEHVVGDLQHGEGRDAGGEARQPHQRQAQQEREHAAERGGQEQRRDVADRVVAQQREQAGQHGRLRLERDRHLAGRERADGDEADVPEREHARVADEHVDRDDHRDRDQRVEEVDVVGGRDEAARRCPRGSRARRARRAARARCDGAALIPGPPRTIARVRTARRAARAARRSRARRRTTAGRSSCSVGSAPSMIPLANPIAKPPSVAVQSRSIPPTTTPTSTRIVSFSANVCVTSGCCTVSITATIAASSADSSTAKPITWFASTPSMRAVRKSIAAARMRSPMLVRPSSSASSPSVTSATATATNVILRMSTPADRDRLVQRGERRGGLALGAVAQVDRERERLQRERDREGGDEHDRRRVPAQRPEHAPGRARTRARSRRRSRRRCSSRRATTRCRRACTRPAITSWP